MFRLMKKTMKILSVLLALSFALIIPVSAADSDSVTAKLFNTYGDEMLFQHSEKAVLAGIAKSGSEISCILKNSSDEIKGRGQTVAGADDRFKVSFDAPEGGYEEYSIEMYQDGVLFDTLTDVVFGELWLAGGQSNMHIFLRFTKTGMEMIDNGKTGSEYVRYLNMPLIPGYSADPNHVAIPGEAANDSPCPLLPQEDIAGAEWFKGSSTKVYDVTGVGFFFAEKLQKDIDMPVGILCDYLGGSSILPWLSRKAIESDKQVKSEMGSRYISANKWDETANYSNMTVMTGLYNKKTAPLINFHIAGMIWYQGESDCNWTYLDYSHAMRLLQDSLTEDFDYKGERLPVIMATFADCALGTLDGFRRLGAELGEFAAQDPSSRAVTVLSDLPLGYTQSTQTVHPYEKKPVGERMALQAEGLVYNKYSHACSSPVFKSIRTEGSSLYLTFDNVCDGLAFDGSDIHGFTVCGKNGVYVPAHATIVSKDTVRVWSRFVEKPVAAMYSEGLITTRSNLYSTVNGEKFLPVCHTITDRKYEDNIWQDCGWTDCDQETIWHQETLKLADFYTIWKADNAKVSVEKQAANRGDAGLNISSDGGTFSIGPVTTRYNQYEDETSLFANWNKDWTKFSKISVEIRNPGNTEIRFEGIKLYVSEDKYYMPVLEDSGETGCSVPADGQWHEYIFDLDNMYAQGKNSAVTYTRKNLKNVTDVKFEFSSGSKAELFFDEIQFAPYKYAVSGFRIFGFDILTMFSKLFTR